MAVMDALLRIKANVQGGAAITKLGDQLGQVRGKAQGLASGLGGLSSTASAVTASLTALAAGGALKGVMDTFGTYQADIKALENGLKNLGGNAPSYLEPLKKLASDLGEQTLFNESDFNKSFGLLTSFGNIGVKNYERVARAASDVAQISGTDVNAAMMQLAKALNAPSQGVSALARSGIQFTEAQKEMIKEMEKAGNIAGAQELIFKELEKQYGGASIAAAQGYAGAMDTLGEKFYDLQKAIGPLLEAGLVPLISLLTTATDIIANTVIPVFNSLPGPIKSVIGVVTLLGVALFALLPIISILVPGLVQLGAILGGLSLGATIAGWAGAIGPAIAAMTAAFSGFLAFLTGTLLPGLVAFFSGPVGWTVLAVAAVVAMAVAFREPIGKFFSWLGGAVGDLVGKIPGWLAPIGKVFADLWVATMKTAYQLFVAPWVNLFNIVIRRPVVAMLGWLTNIVKAPFETVVNFVRGIINSLLGGIENAINSAVRAVNVLISAYNALPTPDLPLVPTVSIPRFAQGGVVDRPTLALVGEGGEREYIIPESKMAATSANYLATNGGTAASMRPAQINITTGPILQAEDQQWVTVNDLMAAMRATEAATLARLRTPAGRRAVGVR